MADFGQFRGFGDKLFQGQLPTQLGKIGSENFGFEGILDSYPNAAAAYSLRKLRSAYTGSAIRVRRSSDNTEQDIGFIQVGTDFILDTSSLTSFCGSGNGFVTTWYDQSGNSNNAVQSTATNQPQIVSSGSVITENSKSTLQFDGTNDRIGFTEITGVTGLTLISIHNYTTISISQTIYEGSDTLTAYTGSFVRDMSIGGRQNKAQIYFEDGTSRVLQGNTITTNVPYVQFGYVSSTGTGISLNGNLTTGTAAVNNCIVRAIAQDIGSPYFNGKITELIIYTSDQSSNRTAIESNINSYYNIY